MTGTRWLLLLLFRLNGLFLMLAFFAIFLPVMWMETISGWLGLKDIPLHQQPITIYLARSASLLYAVHGFLTFWVSLYPKKYWDLIPVFAILHIFIGIFMLGIDLTSGMPWYWTAGEGGPIAVFGLVLLWLFRKCDAEEPAKDPAEEPAS